MIGLRIAGLCARRSHILKVDPELAGSEGMMAGSEGMMAGSEGMMAESGAIDKLKLRSNCLKT